MTRTLYPVANSVGPQQVRETDDAYIIEDVPIVQPMELAGGYVPEQSIRDTADAWDGVPATLNHPRDDQGKPVAANRQPETHIGTTTDTAYDGTHVRGNLRVDKDRLDTVGGEADDIRRALEAGEQIDVSSQYAAEPLPAGEYDGAHRSNVERITRPDSVALLPNKRGVCSIEDGCGINPQLAANAAVSVPMTATKQPRDQDIGAAAEAAFNEGDLVRWRTSASPGSGRVNTVVTEPGATVSAEGADATREATDDEAVYKLDNWVGPDAGYDEGVVVKSASEILGGWEDAPDEAVSANMAIPDEYRFDNPGEAVEKAQEMGFEGAGDEVIHTHEADGETVFMPAPDHETLLDQLEDMEDLDAGGMSDNALASAFDTLRAAVFGADDGATPEAPTNTTANDTTPTPPESPSEDRQQLIDDITANSPLTEAALTARCTDGLQAIHSDIMAASDSAANNPDDSDTTDTDTDMSDNSNANDTPDDAVGLDDLTDNAREALVDEAVEQIEANREDEQKEQVVSEIIANSADYDSDDRETLLEAPLDVLKGLQSTAGAASVPGAGATANAQPDTGTESASDYPDGTIGGDL